MKKIVSIALFGDANRKDGRQNYHAYLPTFVLAHANLFPVNQGWELHVHVDEETMAGEYGTKLIKMQERGLLRVELMGEAALTQAMLWRMAPVFDLDADYVFCRDIDCVPMPRDRAVCDVFIASRCAVHTVHDAPVHVGIMGGLCGFRSSVFKSATGLFSLRDLYNFARKTEMEWAQHGTDQIVLNRLVDRAGGPTLLEHRYGGWHAGPGTNQPKRAGEYRCKAWTTPTPDKGKSSLSPDLQAQADLLANHLGAAGYDIRHAWEFWVTAGDAEITKRVAELL